MDKTAAITKTLTGDETGYRMLFANYHNRLLNYVMSLGRISRDEAKDIVQEVFVKTFRNLGRLDNHRRFRQWLYSIARNTALMFLSRRAREETALDELWQRLRLTAPADDDTAGRAADAIRTLIEELPDGDIKATVKAYYLDDERLSTEALAGKLGVPKRTMTARLKRFRDTIKARLAARLLELEYEL